MKHKPRTLSEVVGNSEPTTKFAKWVKSWGAGIPKRRAAFLYGPPGVGKTICVEALANDLGLELVEKNASDYRTADAVQRFAGLASQYGTLFGDRRLILLDELDGITGTADRGGVRAVIQIVKDARSPLVLVANNAYAPKLRSLRRYCLLIEFKKPTVRQIASHLEKICTREDIAAEEKALKFIVERSGRDVRSAVNDLQALAQGRKRITYQNTTWLAERDRKDVIFNVLKMVFYSRDAREAKRAVDQADVDRDMLFEWIYENAPHQLTDPRDLAVAMNYLSLADLYRGRIRITQNWSLLRYVIDFMTAGVAMSRKWSKPSGWVPYRFPERIQWLSRTRSERQMQSRIGMKIKKKCHISANRAAKEILPYLRVMLKNDTKMVAGMAKWFDLDDDIVKYLRSK